MDLPINDKELNTIISAMRLGGDAALYQKNMEFLCNGKLSFTQYIPN